MRNNYNLSASRSASLAIKRPSIQDRKEMSEFYFSPSEAEIEGFPLSPYEKHLLSRLIQTLRLGVHISNKRNNTASPINNTRLGAAECEAYIKSAFSSQMLSDKLFPLRHTGPSMQFILKRFPIPERPSQVSAKDVFQLCIWRTFAFGNSNYLEQITLGDKEPDLERLNSTIQQWGNGPLKLSVPAYGQLQIIKAKIPEMLSSFWDLCLDISVTQTPKRTALTFVDLHGLLLGKKISSIPRHGLISWLLTSDFFEYGLCQPPTIQDLADHITNSGASGPKGAIRIVAEVTGQPAPSDANELAKVLGNVFTLLQSPPESSPTLSRIAEDCKTIQGRTLAVVDLEHALCKISRQNARAKAGKGKVTVAKRKVVGSRVESTEDGSLKNEVEDSEDEMTITSWVRKRTRGMK